MNEIIKKYRERRDARLKKRCDADSGDFDWITSNGSHIPLENGTSVGGWSKGRDFSGAKSVKRYKSYGESNIKRAMEKKARHYNNGKKVETNNHINKRHNSDETGKIKECR